ncbi:WxcM-like domain-containing protein [Enterobacter oligotrophicus]|uniref:sugar 3,4-ketoisomerase n=1 Tax=Enterobacteriaceae TaxID=543 RepID=UPI001C02BB9C|nr:MULTISPECIES: FdtA/QdtA family cupin domain-containing protein [Enterobacteriaceae]ELW1645430.1 WxcM-like domain-containing protein [Enterobacter oligotrophicus]MBT9424573.1 WxcM-like domain-containing protein [Enterobacter oligotrophicus]MDT7485027.1 FdtA/QdtA family cupin domain-containing protein [Citrobacter koseri]HEM6716107.1 WxcM-like domain-containing protein [Citrobacter koseri]
MKVELIPLQKHGDERGMLVALEQTKNVPFEIKRVYYMFGTQTNVRRGYHAHKELRQLAIPVSGSCRFMLDDGKEKVDILLDNPALGLLIEPSIWHEMYDYSHDCILLVLASDVYNESDYIRNYDEFVESVE